MKFDDDKMFAAFGMDVKMFRSLPRAEHGARYLTAVAFV